VIWVLCVLIILTGLIIGYRDPIVSWFRGGVPQISVKAENRGLARHSIRYIAAHGGHVIRPVANAHTTWWSIGGHKATIREAYSS
jgi:hypothetical protein